MVSATPTWRDRWKFAAKYERERANEAERNMMQTHARSMEWLGQKDALIREILEATNTQVNDLATLNAELLEALRFYARDDHYIALSPSGKPPIVGDNFGDTARAAIAKATGKEVDP